MSRSSPIYCKVTREGMSRVEFGSRESFEQTILVGTSATNSHELATIAVRKHVAPGGGVTFSLTIDGQTVKRGHLLNKELHVYEIKAGDR